MAFLDLWLAALASAGVDLQSLAVAWARALPAALLVPAFGMRALPWPVRALFGAAILLASLPAMAPLAEADVLWPVLLAREAAKGLPIAVTAAVALWAATMAGGLIDNLASPVAIRGVAVVEADATPMGSLLGLLAIVGFFEIGGASRLARALSDPDLSVQSPLSRAAFGLASGIELAISVAAPLLVLSIVLDVAGALLNRSAGAGLTRGFFAQLRVVLILAAAAILLEQMAELIARASTRFL